MMLTRDDVDALAAGFGPVIAEAIQRSLVPVSAKLELLSATVARLEKAVAERKAKP